MPSTSPRVGLSYPVSTDTPDVPRDIKAVTDALDVTLGAPSFTSTTRPLTGNYVGRLIFETDTQNVTRFDGTNWNVVSSTSPPRCQVYNATQQPTLTSGTGLLFPWDAEQYDTDNMHSLTTSTSRLTANTPGLYDIKGQLNFGTPSTGSRQLAIYKNGAAYAYSSIPAFAGSAVVQIHREIFLAAGDYVELQATQTNGTNYTIINGIAYNFFSARWVASS